TDRFDAYVARLQVLIDNQWAVLASEEAWRLTVEDGAVIAAHQGTDLHPGRQLACRSQVVEDGAERRKVGRRGRKIALAFVAPEVGVAGHGRQAGLDVVGLVGCRWLQ